MFSFLWMKLINASKMVFGVLLRGPLFKWMAFGFFVVRLQHRLRVDRAPTRSYQRYLSLQWVSIFSHNRNRKFLRRSILIQHQHVIFFLFTRWHGQPMGLSIFQIVALRNNSTIIDHYRHLYVFIVVSNSMNNLYKLYTRNWRTTNK